MKVKIVQLLFVVAVIAVLSIFCSMPVKNVLGENHPEDIYIEVELTHPSDDLLLKVISPENQEQILIAGQGMPLIPVGSTIEVLNGFLSCEYREYNIKLSAGNKIVAQPTSILVEKGPVVISFVGRSIILKDGESFDFENASKITK